ncbi:MAG: O-methyltransferase [Terriglobia bacterium]
MSAITDAKVEKYLYSLLPEREEVLAEMERLAAQRNIPIVGPAVGRVLYQLVQLIGAKRIFELGSAIGYSTLWLARAAGPGATIYYSDDDAENAQQARAFFAQAGLADRINILVGNSLELIQQVPGPFDFIFNDVDKHDYPNVFRLAVPRLRGGGLFVTDNALWFGRVARRARDRETDAIQEFNRLIYSSPELFTTILPLRDGLAVCHKL